MGGRPGMNLIKKAFDILDIFLDHGPELSLEDMSRLAGINKATTRRIAVMLIENGCLKQPVKRGKYSLGMRFLDFSGAIKKSNGIIDVAGPLLTKLNHKMNESVGIALWDGISAVTCHFFLSDHLLKVVPYEGTKLGMYYSSLGKAILAELTENEQNRFMNGKLTAFTLNTITNRDLLKQHLAKIKKEGAAFDDEEYAVGVRGVAVPLKNSRGELVGAIGMIGPSARVSLLGLQAWVPMLTKCAKEISQQLDYISQRKN
jgi:IclR family transcriptional regulator, KDG regulon repressor